MSYFIFLIYFLATLEACGCSHSRDQTHATAMTALDPSPLSNQGPPKIVFVQDSFLSFILSSFLLSFLPSFLRSFPFWLPHVI